MRTELARSRITCRSALWEPRRISSSAGCESSAARCRSTSSAVLHSTMPAHLPEIHLGEHGAHFEGPDLDAGTRFVRAAAADRPEVWSRDFTLGEGESVTFVLAPSGCRGCTDVLSRCRAGGGPLSRDRRFLAAMAFQVHLFRSLARDRAAFRFDAQTSVLRADRRDRGRSHVQLAGVDRWTTQLGLSVYLDS